MQGLARATAILFILSVAGCVGEVGGGDETGEDLGDEAVQIVGESEVPPEILDTDRSASTVSDTKCYPLRQYLRYDLPKCSFWDHLGAGGIFSKDCGAAPAAWAAYHCEKYHMPYPSACDWRSGTLLSNPDTVWVRFSCCAGCPRKP